MPLSGGMITPNFLLSDARYNNGLGPSQYDPNFMVDPTSAIQMQQQYLKQMFAMQNPRLALPQQFGSALGAALSGGQAAGQQMPTGGQQGPQDPVAQVLHAKSVEYGKTMDAGAALYKAASDIENDPSMSGLSQNTDKIVDKARTWAIEKLKYNPEQEKQRDFERSMKGSENLTDGTTTRAFKIGSQEYNEALATGRWRKAAELSQLPVGHTATLQDLNGVTHNMEWDGSKYIVPQDKGVPKTGVPAAQRNLSLTDDSAKDAWNTPGNKIPSFGPEATNSTIKTLTDRSISTKNFVDSLDLLDKTATPGSIGVPGDVNEKASNILSTISTLAGQLGTPSDPNKYKMNWSPGLAKDVVSRGIDAEKVKALMLHAALLHEATYGDKNATDSNRKFAVEQQLKILGEDSSSLPALKATLAQSRQLAVSQLNNEFDGKPNVMDKPAWLKQENSKQTPKTQAHKPFADPAKEARYQAWLKAQRGS